MDISSNLRHGGVQLNISPLVVRRRITIGTGWDSSPKAPRTWILVARDAYRDNRIRIIMAAGALVDDFGNARTSEMLQAYIHSR